MIKQRLTLLTDRLVDLRERHIPQLFVGACGMFGTLVGFLFLVIPGRFEDAPALAFLINIVPPLAWGLMFFALGISLFTVALIDYTRAVLPCLVLGLLCFSFSALSLVDLFSGPATGLVVVAFAVLGWINWLTLVLSIAPVAQQGLRQ
jgi:hypothetical protein